MNARGVLLVVASSSCETKPPPLQVSGPIDGNLLTMTDEKVSSASFSFMPLSARTPQ